MIMRPLEYLKKLESYGYSSYIVGGYVRDRILGIESSDIDIATSAKPRDVANIFGIKEASKLGCISIRKNGLTIDITTFRREANYDGRHPKELIYVDDIDEDLLRRDFTVNAICMDSDENIYDPLGGIRDLEAKNLRVIGDIPTKFTEDPLRILRAIRFAVIYDFNIDSRALEFIKKNGMLLKSISKNRRKEELDKIFASGKALKGLNFLERLGILEALGITISNSVKDVKDLAGFWTQLEAPGYPFKRIEKMRMSNIKNILDSQDVNIASLFTYGLYDNLVAGEIMGIERNRIISLYESMPIHSKEDLAIDGNKIMDIFNLDSSPFIKEIKKCLISEVLSGNLSNSEANLVEYLIQNKEVIENGRHNR